MNNQTLKNVFLSYRNGFYQGQMKDDKRHGNGILLLDDGTILVVNWKDDLASGIAFCYINNEEYGFLQFNRGELEGPCIFKSGYQLLIMQFNNGRAVDRHLLINYQEQQAKMIIYRNATYQIIDKFSIKNTTQSEIIQKTTGLRIGILPLRDFLHKNFCNNGQTFQIKTLPNGNHLFRYIDQSSTLTLGFVINKNEQLVSYGIYNTEQKLHEFGCKYENNIKYQGSFYNGVLNGQGLKFSNGKYSYGVFENGNLVEALFLDERSNASLQRLKQLKRMYHIQSPFFYNAYIKKRLVNFKGISEINSLSSPVKEFLYNNNSPQTQKVEQNNNQNIGKSINSMSLNLLLSGKHQKQSSQQQQQQQYRFDTHINPNYRQPDNIKFSNSQARQNNNNNAQIGRKVNF